MRMRLAVAAVVLAVAGCKSQKLLAVETELAAAKARVATLEKKRQDLNAESRKLQVERKTFSQQADEAALARERLVAAGLVLGGAPVPDGIQLDEALRVKSPELGALAAQIVQRQLPCADPDATDAEGEGEGEDCGPPPLSDACEGVAERTTQAFTWSCELAPGAIPTAVCLSPAELDRDLYPLAAPTAHLTADVVRLAYEKNGRLVVADWPAPDTELYRPTNWSERASCEEENGHNQCIRSCDERHGRLNSGCVDDGAGDEGAQYYDDDENPEPYELRAAREAAQRAEREAAEARDELSYQECLAGCEGPASEPEPIARVGLKFVRSPAPGLFQFDVAIEQEDGGVPAHTLVLSFGPLHSQLGGSAYFEKDAGDTVVGLETALDVQQLFEGPVVEGTRVLAGLTPGELPTGVTISLDGLEAPSPLGLDEVCEFGAKLKPPRMVQECVAAKAQRELAAKKASKDAGVDAGAAPASVDADAGVTP